MNLYVLLIELIFVLLDRVCCTNGFQSENTYLDNKSIDLESLPLKTLLEMKRELRKKDHPARWNTAAVAPMTTADFELRQRPNAMALQSRADSPAQASSAGSSVQTAFQMSLTVLSFLAFGGYVISLVTQNMRKPPQPDGMTVPQPLKTVVVNQQRRPLYHPISGSTMTSVSFGRRKRSRRRRYA